MKDKKKILQKKALAIHLGGQGDFVGDFTDFDESDQKLYRSRTTVNFIAALPEIKKHEKALDQLMV